MNGTAQNQATDGMSCAEHVMHLGTWTARQVSIHLDLDLSEE
jgi:hypothetical protein